MDPNLTIEEIDFSKYWLVLRRRWRPAIGAFGLVVLASLAFGFSKKPVYEAEGRLLFKTDRSASLTGLGEELGGLQPLTFRTNPVDNQVEMMKSYNILEAVIEELDLRDSDNLLLKPSYLAEKIKVKTIPSTDIISISFSSGDPDLAALVVNKTAEVFIKLDIQENRIEAAAARDFVSQQLPKTQAALNQAELNLKQFKERNQIFSVDQEAQSLVEISFDLKKQLDDAEAQLSSIDATLTNYQEQLNLQDPQFAIVLAALNQSSGVQQVLQELQQVEADIASQSALFTSNSQAITRLSATQENLQKVLQQRINQVVNDRPFFENTNLQIGDLQTDLIGQIISLEAQKQALRNRINTFSQQINGYRQRISILPELEKQNSELERDLAVAETTYQTLLTRFQELQIEESQNIGNARLISPAVIPSDPTGPGQSQLFCINCT